MKIEYRLYELIHDRNQVDLTNWLAELNRLGADGWDVVCPVDQHLLLSKAT